MKPKSYVDAMLEFRGVRKHAAVEAPRKRRLVGVAESSRSNPLRVRRSYKRHEQLQSDLTRYYESCIVQKTADVSTISARDKAYCAGVAWERAKASGRYSDYPGFDKGSGKMARRMSKLRNRARDRFGRFMDAAESKSKRKAKKRKAATSGAKKARKAAKRAATKAQRSQKAVRKAAKRAAKKSTKKSTKKKSAAKKSAAKKPKKSTSKKQSRREDTTMAKKSGSKKKKSSKKGRKAARRSSPPETKKTTKKAKKSSPKKSASKRPAARKPSKKPRKSGSAPKKKRPKKTTTATIHATRRVRRGGGTRSVPANISIRIGAPQPVRKAAKRKGGRKSSKRKSGAREGFESFALNPVTSEYALENPMTGSELLLGALAGGAGYVLASMMDRYIATRERDPKDIKPGEPILSPAEQVAAPPGILRVIAQGGVAAASFVGAYFVPQPMGRAALQGFGLGALTHLTGQLITTYVVARFLKSNDTVKRMYPAEIAVNERLNPPKAPGQQGLPYGVAGFLGRQPQYGHGVPGAGADMMVRPPTLDPAYAPPLYREGGNGGCSPCQPCGDSTENGTLKTVEKIAAESPVASQQQTVDAVMRAAADESCKMGVGAPPNGVWHNAMFLGRDD